MEGVHDFDEKRPKTTFDGRTLRREWHNGSLKIDYGV